MTEQKKLAHPKYRSDIDGLRALAVLSVIGFHAFPKFLKGGFIGVDIFFVISGFLISTIIFENLKKNSFNFFEFYSRRINRIFPALLVVLSCVSIFGWLFLLADQYIQLGKHIASGAGFISNFTLWQESGYFDNSAEGKPLLHLWSLGIEEQFYLIWPLLIWGAYKFKINFFAVLLIVFLASFSINLNEVSIDPVKTFYLPQGRFWELIIGGLAAFILNNKIFSEIDRLNLLKNALSILGSISIILGVVLISKDKHFPGTWALLPTLGAFAIILAGPKAIFNRLILSRKMLIWFGLISFPLYLWHWPILSFLKIALGNDLIFIVKIVAISVSILAAWITFRFVEKPIKKDYLGRYQSLILSGLMLIALGAGVLIVKKHGFVDRSFNAKYAFNNKQLEWHDVSTTECANLVGLSPEPALFCNIWGDQNNIKIAVIGDSTANALSPGLANIFANNNTGLINIGEGTCPTINGLQESKIWGGERTQLAQNCPKINKKIFAYINKTKSIELVIISIFARDLQVWGGARYE